MKWTEMSLNELKRALMDLSQSKWAEMRLNERGLSLSEG